MQDSLKINGASILIRFFLKTLARTMAIAGVLGAVASSSSSQPRKSQTVADSHLLNEVEHRAFLFFWQQSGRTTGLTLDRASNVEPYKKYTVASIASTGYALAALPIAVSHHWITNREAYQRALLTLNFVVNKLPSVHGWYYHFIDINTGARQWKCEVSSIDTALLLQGALIDSAFWPHSAVERLAGRLYSNIDWHWMLTNGGLYPHKLVFSMGWHPETGFIKSNWDSYCELMTLLLPSLGAPRNAPPAAIWMAWKRPRVTYHGLTTLTGGPIFLHEMAQEFYDFNKQRDRAGYNYFVSARHGILINREFCIDNSSKFPSMGPNFWGLNASDAPDGYDAFGAPGGPIDGTVSPTGAVAAIQTSPKLAIDAAKYIYATYHKEAWGRYGFADALNPSRSWFDHDVIGIDLGMAMLAIENARTGLVWKLEQSLPSTRRAFTRAGFRPSTNNDLLQLGHR